MANTGEEIGVNYPTLMPDLTDIADIQQAYQMYHIGIANWDGITPPAANSIEGHFSSVNQRVDDLEARPVGGGEVSPTEPTVVGPQMLPVPEGYVWVDQDAEATIFPQMPTVVYSPTQPTGLTVADTGTIWIDSDTLLYYVWTGAAFVLTTAPSSSYASSAPIGPQVGQLWVDSVKNIVFVWTGTAWEKVKSIGATGGGQDDIFYENSQVVTQDYTISSQKNAGSFGPVEIASGVVVTIPSGSVWTIV